MAPGERPWPFHFHHVNEELFYVLSGRGELRTPGGVLELEPGDAVCCAPGPGGAHALRGGAQGTFEYLAISTLKEPEVSEYPDSGKICVMVGAAPGADSAARRVDATFRLRDAVSYLEGEDRATP
ncbi:MAG: cupin domain-containing protein [Gemmatimonadota bacterium]